MTWRFLKIAVACNSNLAIKAEIKAYKRSQYVRKLILTVAKFIARK